MLSFLQCFKIFFGILSLYIVDFFRASHFVNQVKCRVRRPRSILLYDIRYCTIFLISPNITDQFLAIVRDRLEILSVRFELFNGGRGRRSINNIVENCATILIVQRGRFRQTRITMLFDTNPASIVPRNAVAYCQCLVILSQSDNYDDVR